MNHLNDLHVLKLHTFAGRFIVKEATIKDYPFKDEAQNALFKDPVRTAL